MYFLDDGHRRSLRKDGPLCSENTGVGDRVRALYDLVGLFGPGRPAEEERTEV